MYEIHYLTRFKYPPGAAVTSNLFSIFLSITNSSYDLRYSSTAVFGLFPFPQGRSEETTFESSIIVSKTTH